MIQIRQEQEHITFHMWVIHTYPASPDLEEPTSVTYMSPDGDQAKLDLNKQNTQGTGTC